MDYQKSIDKITEEWEKDSKIDFTNLDMESLKVPELHSKYYKMYLYFMNYKKELKKKHYKLLSDKTNWYLGIMDSKELIARKWNPYPMPVKNNKTVLDGLLDKDKDLIEESMIVSQYDDITDYIKSILDCISKRSFQIKNAIDWRKFINNESS